ncbi:transglutaminase domain-containing protein [Draconibacterium sp. IB214405]|uniref:transglutaminase-like domain-containing protein n=1 Tax=Draconibacterium sp. IB214405 TaxID=3097352 RepID=UPI002A14EFA9|nr:transglutaminase domain-containing protein [Draconibacterium sp. IB214405]MDX8340131.1 transglutaminase domain-containing protein [Draconibacterium sp. IB214405]
MKFLHRLLLTGWVLFLCSCQNQNEKLFDFQKYLDEGKFSEAEVVLKEKIQKNPDNSEYQIQLETIDRLRKEFPYTRTEVKARLSEYFPDLTDEELNKWEEARQLEMRVIDGEKRYFSRAVSNFFRLNEAAGQIKIEKDGKAYDGVDDFQLTVIPQWFENGITPREPFNPQRIKVNYTITLDANVVPDGEMVKCWLPYPRTGSERLPRVEFLEASQDDYIIAPNETMQRTVYMEKKAVQDEETVFQISYIFETAAQWFDIKPEDTQAYDKNSELYKKYTAERLPHIVFTDQIKSLAKSIVGDEKNPVKQVELLYYWINDNIPWAGALEYSVMPCIPCYVLENMHGDCGMQTFLFLSMARSLGIPCKWQSGWYLLPQTTNLHDWAEVYYEGVGWVPVDPSFKLIDSEDKRVKEFYLNGLDSYRLVVNDDFARELVPAKKYYRSEPFDFQRGELEWKDGNLYFDTWSYDLDFEYLPNS